MVQKKVLESPWGTLKRPRQRQRYMPLSHEFTFWLLICSNLFGARVNNLSRKGLFFKRRSLVWIVCELLHAVGMLFFLPCPFQLGIDELHKLFIDLL
jgi:hypothetical protein